MSSLLHQLVKARASVHRPISSMQDVVLFSRGQHVLATDIVKVEGDHPRTFLRALERDFARVFLDMPMVMSLRIMRVVPALRSACRSASRLREGERRVDLESVGLGIRKDRAVLSHDRRIDSRQWGMRSQVRAQFRDLQGFDIRIDFVS